MTAPVPAPPPPPEPGPVRPPGSLNAAMNWMGCLALLLFWLPLFGPLLAGLVGGAKAGTVKRAVVAVFLPAVLTGAMAAAGVAYLTETLAWSVLAGLGGVAVSLLQVGPLLAGAVAGGFAAHLAWKRRARVRGASPPRSTRP